MHSMRLGLKAGFKGWVYCMKLVAYTCNIYLFCDQSQCQAFLPPTDISLHHSKPIVLYIRIEDPELGSFLITIRSHVITSLCMAICYPN